MRSLWRTQQLGQLVSGLDMYSLLFKLITKTPAREQLRLLTQASHFRSKAHFKRLGLFDTATLDYHRYSIPLFAEASARGCSTMNATGRAVMNKPYWPCLRCLSAA